MKFRLTLYLLFLLLVTQPSNAAEDDLTKNILAFGALEGMIVAHSWLLSRSPYGYGVATGLLYPLSGIESNRGPAFGISLAAAEGMNIYNINMERKSISNEEMFKRNIIGWHVVFAVTAASHFLLDDNWKTNRFSFSPTDYGGELRFDFKF